MSVVGAILPLSALTEKDRKDLNFALKMGADWVALSFVPRPEDMKEIRALVGDGVAIMAKLEKPSAIDILDDIVRLSDGLMVARGDLGAEMRPEQVPVIQRQILRACRKVGKPAIVATQMLESMINAPTPTRAEASDVATAIYGGADAVMLSAESAAGQYPVEAVAMMDKIIREVATPLRKKRSTPSTRSRAALFPTRFAAPCDGLMGFWILRPPSPTQVRATPASARRANARCSRRLRPNFAIARSPISKARDRKWSQPEI